MENENKESENVTNPPGEGELPPEEQVQEIPPDPLSYIPSLEKLIPILGDKFINNQCVAIDEQNIKSEIFSAKLIGLFFHGEWGSPSRIFRKLLVDLYNKANEGEKVFEIIEIECPKIVRKAIKTLDIGKGNRKDIEDEEEKKAKAELERKEEEEKFNNFKNDISIKPWKFLPYKDPKIEELKKFYNVTAIPQFFPIDKNGNIISNNARNELMEGGVDVIEEWINVLQDIYEEEHKNDKIEDSNTVPIEEAKEQ